jgi:uncharacterized protein (DUF2267 family)
MTGVQTLNTAVETTEEWISALMVRLGWRHKERAFLALLAALHALRDALPRDEAGYLGVQLPVLLRGLYFEGWHPASHIPRAKTHSAFLERIQEGVHRDPGIDAEQVAHAVFSLLAERLPSGEIEDAKAATPEALRMFWPA